MMTVLAALIACNNSNSVVSHDWHLNNSGDKRQIKQLFADWQKNEIKLGHFWAIDTCNPNYFSQRDFTGTIDQELGIPDSNEINFSFGDLNDDGKLDGLATFTPSQCDGGNASMWTQAQVFFNPNEAVTK